MGRYGERLLADFVGGALPPSEIAFLNLLVDIMFKKTYDAPLKIAVRASQSAEEALQKDGIVQAVQAVEEKRAEEKPPAEKQGGPHG